MPRPTAARRPTGSPSAAAGSRAAERTPIDHNTGPTRLPVEYQHDVAALPILGRTEIADLLQVQRGTVNRWIQRKVIPAPDYRLAAGNLWLRATIERWARETQRWPHPDDTGPLALPDGWSPPEWLEKGTP